MGMNLLTEHERLQKRRVIEIFDHFSTYATGGLWTSVTEGSATVAAGDNSGGVLTLSCIDSTDNREVYVRSTNALFLWAANRPLYVEAGLAFTEGNTNAANVAFGVMNSVTQDVIVDNGAGLKTSGSFAAIYKVDGGTVWKMASSLSTTQTVDSSDQTAGSLGTQAYSNADGVSFQRLGILMEPVSSTLLEVTYFVNGKQLRTSSGRPGQNLIKHYVTYTGAAIMQLFVGLKNGSTTAEVVKVDYLAAEYLVGNG